MHEFSAALRLNLHYIKYVLFNVGIVYTVKQLTDFWQYWIIVRLPNIYGFAHTLCLYAYNTYNIYSAS